MVGCCRERILSGGCGWFMKNDRGLFYVCEAMRMADQKAANINLKVRPLFETVAGIQRKYLARKKAGQMFNLFTLFHAAGSETKVCRVLRELLDPRGSHGQESIYLELFFQIVFGQELPPGEVCIRQEFRIENDTHTGREDRRIDLVLQAQDCFIAIEVKIYAGDQQGQCYDYFREVQQHAGQLYYLTLYGARPSTYSLTPGAQDVPLKPMEIDSIHAISFQGHILNWLQACLAETQKRKVLPMALMLEQFMEAIRRWTEEVDEETMELKDLLEGNPETLLLAGKIEKALVEVKKGLLPRVMKNFKRKVEGGIGDFIWVEERMPDQLAAFKEIRPENERNDLEAFYNSPDTGDGVKRIGMYWLLKNPKKTIHLCLGIEVQCNLYARVIAYEEGGKWNFLDEDNKANYVYLPLVPSYSGKTDLKHYHKMNEEMMKLFADDQLDKAVTLNMQHIKELLERVPHFA